MRPFTRTRPSVINRSAARRDDTPACASTFCKRCIVIKPNLLVGVVARHLGLVGLLCALPRRVAIPVVDAGIAVEVRAHSHHLAAFEILPAVGAPLRRAAATAQVALGSQRLAVFIE